MQALSGSRPCAIPAVWLLSTDKLPGKEGLETVSDKREAIARVNSHIGRKLLNHQNTHFSNVNRRYPVWWLDIPVRKVGKQLHVLLRWENGGLIWLRCPPDILDSSDFRYRPDKDVVSLEIETGSRLLRDRQSGYGFSQYVELELPGI